MLFLLLACAPKHPDGKEEPVCRTPNASSAWSGSTVFREATEEWGLTGKNGGRYATGDLNGDGYPDLLATEVFSNDRDDPASGLYYHRVLINDKGHGFLDQTVESGLITARDGHLGTSSVLHVMGDVDNDGDLDIFAGANWDAGDDKPPQDLTELFLNDGTGHFTHAPNSDIAHPEGYPSTSASFLDYNGDGILDLWAVGWYIQYGYDDAAQAHLYQGNGDGTFHDVTDEMGLTMGSPARFLDRHSRRPAFGATACEVNGDGIPDLISTNYGRTWNHLWLSEGGKYVEHGEDSHIDGDANLDYRDNTMYACYCETHTCDPAPTVRCGGTWPDYYWTVGRDDQPVRLNGNSFSTACGDIDNDGDNDVYTAEIAHLWAGQSSDRSQLALNDGAGVFQRLENESVGLDRPHPRQGDWNEGDMYVSFFDFDNDGWKDILVVSTDYPDTKLWFWRQVSPGMFEEVSDQTGLNQPWPGGMAIADFDLDGDLDVVTGSSTARTGTPWTDHQTHLYLNDSPVGNWIQFTGFPIGTRVEVTAGGVTQMQEVSGGYGQLGIQNDLRLHFGLGEVCQVETVKAVYPGGKEKTWEQVAGNRAVELE